MISFLTTAGIFIGAIFILVLIHELGHFLAARMFGIRVDRFSIGFPPRLFGIKIGDTDYCVSGTPLGGYVKIAGMIDESMDNEFLNHEPQPWEYRSKPVWQRAIVISGGVIFNVILAWVIYSGLALSYGNSYVPAENVGGLYIPESSLAAEMGFVSGDRVLSVNGEPVKDFGADIFSMAHLSSGKLAFEVERNGEKVLLETPEGFLNKLSKNEQGMFTIANALPNKISDVVGGSPASVAGLLANDQIVAINGVKTSYWLEMVEQIRAAGEQLQFRVLRGTDTLDVAVVRPADSKTVGIYPVDVESYFGIRFEKFSVAQSLAIGFTKTGDSITGILKGLKQMVSGSISFQENLGGPIAIANVTRQATESGGWRGFWVITAYLSVTLAIMNLIPLPVLDGGHLMFLGYEAIFRREPSVKIRTALQQAGFLFFILLFVFVTYNDISRLIFR